MKDEEGRGPWAAGSTTCEVRQFILHPSSLREMAVSTAAIGGVASALVGEDRETDANELVRIAREALFVAPRPDARKD